MKKHYQLLILSVFLVLPATVFSRDRMQIVGSSTVYPFSTIIAEKLGSKGIIKTPVVESTGTGGGMKLFCAGVGEKFPDITNASRAIKSSELENCKKNKVSEIIEIVVGNDGIAFANSHKGKKLNLTRSQLWKAMAAKGPKPMMWNEIDPTLPKTKIEILTPPPTSGTRDAWNSLVMKKGCDAKVKENNKKDCELMREDGIVVEAGENDALIVQKLAANPSAFGIFGFSYLENNRDKIQPMTIEGVEISLDSIQAYDYPISRPLYFYVKKAHIGVVPGIKEFMKTFVSKSAIGEEGYLVDAGLVPLSDKKLNHVRGVVSGLTVLN